MHLLILILISVFIVSLFSLVGIFFISLKKKLLEKTVLILVAFASGALLGGAFLHLLPEAYEECACNTVFVMVLLGIILFFLTEKILHWRHCHDGKCDVHTFTYLNLIGDGVHNFIDGLIIAAAFIGGIPLGITTTLAIIFHEIPQEIGDFGVLIYGGFAKKKALFFNFLSALTAILGAIFGYFLSAQIKDITPFLLAFAAGGFIYIASSDLIPELHKTEDIKKSMVQFVFLFMGIALMWLMKYLFG